MKEIIEKIGIPAILENNAEECMELGHACLKLSRVLRKENPTPVTREDAIAKVMEEAADVTLMVEALYEAGLISSEDVEHWISGKKQRWIKRMKEIEEEIGD